jgi:hypothetical protein
MVDVGSYGSNPDGAIFQQSPLGKAYLNNKLGIPYGKKLPNYIPTETNEPVMDVPYLMVADAAFPLKPHLMRPYPGERAGTLTEEESNFNYRLSRARRIIESVFGILVARWRIYERRINMSPERVETAAKATIVLHNYLTTVGEDIEKTLLRLRRTQQNHQMTPGQGIQDVRSLKGNTATDEGKKIRKYLTGYFASPTGHIYW